MTSLDKRDHDIIIAGGGLAGMITASSAAYYSGQTLRILVVDRNPLCEVGKKTITSKANQRCIESRSRTEGHGCITLTNCRE